MPTRRSAARLLLAPLAFLAACSSPTAELPLEEQAGDQLYKSQACARCHGTDGTSAFWLPGPDLLPHLDSWTVQSLAAYLADPSGVAEGIERLAGEGKMPEFGHLDGAARRRLAEYVLTLGNG